MSCAIIESVEIKRISEIENRQYFHINDQIISSIIVNLLMLLLKWSFTYSFYDISFKFTNNSPPPLVYFTVYKYVSPFKTNLIITLSHFVASSSNLQKNLPPTPFFLSRSL